MTTLDIRGTVVGETALAIKAPVICATAGSNITLSGVQVIDGVTVGNNAERVLVKDQSVVSQNGIYIAETGSWVLAADFTSNNNVALGTLVLVTSGNTNAGLLFEQVCPDNPIVIGTSLIAFSSLAANTSQAATSSTSAMIGTGAKTFAVQAGKAFAAGQYVVIYETSAPATNSMLATVTSYSGTSLVVNVVATSGSGTYTDWSIVLTNSSAAAGIQPPVGSGNVTGPGSSTTGHIATFADGTGKVIQDGGAAGLPGASSITPSMLTAAAVASGAAMLNGYIVPSNNGTALTLAVKTLAGNDPSATDPVWFVFNQTASAAPAVIELTAPLSLTIPFGSTLGTSNSTPFRFWLLAVNNAGSVALAVINCLSGASIYPLAQGGTISTTAFSVTNNSAQVPYTSAAVGSLSNVNYEVMGFLSYESGLSTAGTYASNPSRVKLFIPGLVALPGHIIQSLAMTTATTNAYSSASFAALAITQNITLSSAANVVRTAAYGWVSMASGATTNNAQIQRGTVAVGQQISMGPGVTASPSFPWSIGPLLDVPASSNWAGGAMTYAVYAKADGTHTNTSQGGGIIVEEIMA